MKDAIELYIYFLMFSLVNTPTLWKCNIESLEYPFKNLDAARLQLALLHAA